MWFPRSVAQGPPDLILDLSTFPPVPYYFVDEPLMFIIQSKVIRFGVLTIWERRIVISVVGFQEGYVEHRVNATFL